MTSKAEKFQSILRELINKRHFSNLTFDGALEYFCQTLSAAVEAERVGIWEWDGEKSTLTALAMWSAGDGRIEPGAELGLEQARSYIEAIQNDYVLVVDDAMSDPCCAELAQDYLPANGITSLLDCPIHNFGAFTGILCVEHVGPKRKWSEAEREFAISIASLVSLTFENRVRVDAESQAHRQRRRYQFYTELAADWYWELDAHFDIVTFTGVKTPQARETRAVIGKKIWDVPNLTPTAVEWSAVKEIFENRRDLIELIVATQDPQGNVLYGELSARPVYDDDGVFEGYWGLSRDVTARVQSEIDLRSSEKKYRNAARLAHLGTWIWDEIEGRITYCSPELAAIYRTTPEELMARTHARKVKEGTAATGWRPVFEKDLGYIHPEDREGYRRVIETASRNETGYEIVNRVILDDGSTRVLHERCEPVFDIEGRFIATSGVLLDITEQEARKADLARSKEQLSNLMDNIPGAIYRVKNDDNWTPIYKSAGFDGLFLGPEAARDPFASGFDYHEVLAPADIERMNAAVAKAIEDGTGYEFEYPVKRSEGADPVWLLERGRPVPNEQGEIELEGILIDVSDKHAAQEALVRSQRLEAVGQLTGGVAHDFNNLLAVILGNLELLKDGDLPAPQMGFIDAAIGATMRGAELTKSMLSFARRARLEPTTFDLNKAITETQSWLGRTLPENIEVNTALAPDLWQIEVDNAGAESLLLNLVLNARDAMQGGGKLTIETANVVVSEDMLEDSREILTKGTYVVLCVSDTGHGIPKEIIHRVFEPFFTTKVAGAGSGLGLSMIQGFIKQSGGSVHVYSEAGIGTTFKIYFKAIAQDAAAQEVKRPPAPKAQFDGLHILLAEDEPEVAKIIKLTLERLGCTVVCAASGDEALEIFLETPSVDLLLTDIVMPGALMGTHLARAVRDLRPDMPVIFMSGYANEAQVHGNGLRAEDIRLSKPVTRDALGAALRRVFSPQ
ncbi:ATP-binding protein [Litorivita sp. NS0012-18]|uniref:ATP-binding protein n=1 Tax=Litorivita sp. NS0012-18 TaxID=3127655 RepID=UPI0031032FC1